MEDADGALTFDFEGGLEAGPANLAAAGSLVAADRSVPNPGSNGGPAGDAAASAGGGRRSFPQTVCRHWLRGLCMKGDACGFLHQYDKARMPVCRFFRLYGECREQDCVYKHTNDDIKECNMYKLGFCPNGPGCRYRHAKVPGPPPPVEEVFQQIQHINSGYDSANRFPQHRNAGYTQQAERPQFSLGSTLANNVMGKPPATSEPPIAEQRQTQMQQDQQQQTSQTKVQNLPNGALNQVNRTTASPLPQGQSRYFIVKSCNRENLELSVQQGVWATQRSNEAKLNEAFDSTENVILIFSINRTSHFQGCAKMTSRIGGYVGGGNWKYEHGTAHYGRNFSVKWLKLCELSFIKTRHLRNPYNENLPVKISRDCQELEPSIGEQLASLLYIEPDSELMAIAVAAESKREEEKAKGVKPDDEAQNPDIVPYEDNEEEEEEESDEEEGSAGAISTSQGRGRGAMWPPQIPLVHGGRPMPGGIRGFPPVMMGADGFGFGGMTPDLYSPRPFGPYGPMGPRLPGNFSAMNQCLPPMDGAGPGPGLMFHGRSAPPIASFPPVGPGMMLGAGRAPFMGGIGMVGPSPSQANRLMGPPPFRPPPPSHGTDHMMKRDQKGAGSDRIDRCTPDLDRDKRLDMVPPSAIAGGDLKYSQVSNAQHGEAFGAGNSFRNEESGSEDEAPRRSRHGEGKKKRCQSEGEMTPDQMRDAISRGPIPMQEAAVWTRGETRPDPIRDAIS